MMTKYNYLCPHCGSTNIKSNGYDDGAGDYGDEIAEQFMCLDCEAYFEGDHYRLIHVADPESEEEPLDDDSDRAATEEQGIPDFDDMGFLRGYKPPSKPEDV